MRIRSYIWRSCHLGVVLALGVLFHPSPAFAANVVFVSDNNPTGFSAPLGGSFDDAFVTILQNAGHNVIRYSSDNDTGVPLTQEHIDALNTNDLIILGRSLGSGAFQGAQGNQWNTNITVPILVQSSYLVRASRLGWFTGESSFNGSPTPLMLVNPADSKAIYLFQDVALSGNATVDPYDEVLDNNTSQTSDAPVAGGNVLATATAISANVMVEFPPGTVVKGTDSLAGYRLFFASGSREADGQVSSAGKENLTPVGEAIFLRAVELAANNGAPPGEADPIVIATQPQDQTVDELGSASFAVGLSQGTLPRFQWYFGDQAIPDATTAQLTINPAQVSDAGAYYVVISNSINVVTSEVANLTVTPDTTPPAVVSAIATAPNSATITYSEPVDALTAGALENYFFDEPATMSPSFATSVLIVSPTVAVVTIDPPLIPGRDYTAVISGVTDLSAAANLLDPNPTMIPLERAGPPAGNIVWVSDNSPTGFAGPVAGFADDYWITNVLQQVGYNVVRFSSDNSQNTLLTPEQIAALNTNDLIIIGRSTGSGAFQSPQGDQWNTNITKPVMLMSAYMLRNSRFGWVNGETGPPDGTPGPLMVTDLSHPGTAYIFQDAALNGNTMVDNLDFAVDRNISLSTDPIAGGFAIANSVNGVVAPVIAEWPFGTIVKQGAHVLAGYRMFFGGGSREADGSGVPTAGKFNLTPTGETIFLRAVELAMNNGQAPDVNPVLPVIAEHPQSLDVEQSRPASFSVTLSEGSFPLSYQWYFNDAPLEGATSRTLTFDRVGDTNQGEYFIVITNRAGAATSEVATLTVIPDTTAPRVVSVASLDGTTIGLCFSEEMDNSFNLVTEPITYTVNGGAVSVNGVTLRPDGRSVVLILGDVLTGPFDVLVSDVTDLAGNPVPPSEMLSSTVAGFTTGDVGAVGQPGSHFACNTDEITIVGGGTDVWGTADQMYLASKTVSGDFDMQVRVTDLRGMEPITKAVLVARESRDADSRGLHISINPVNGRNQIELGHRLTTAGATATWGSTFVPGAIPDAWLRITRVGDLFSGFRSTNGMDWIQMGQTNIVYPAEMVLGIGVTAHNAANTLLATGTFSNFTISQEIQQQPIVNLMYDGTFTGYIQTANDAIYEVQYKDDLNADAWTTLTTINGDGTLQSFTDPGPAVAQRFYRIILR